MFRFFICINLILIHVFCQTTEDNLQFSVDFSISQSWQQDTTDGKTGQLDTNDDTTQLWDQITNDQSSKLNTDYETTQSWSETTTDHPSTFNITMDTTPSWNETSIEQPSTFDTTESGNETTTEQPSIFNIAIDTTESWNEMNSDTPSELNTTMDKTSSQEQITTEEPLESSTKSGITQTGQEFTNEKTSEEENLTITQQISSTTATTINTTCPSCITLEMLEEIKKEIIEAVIRNISREINSRLEEMEARLSALNCSKNNTSSAIELSWQIYENLQIPLTGWLLVFDQPYSHQTRIDDLNQIDGICHNEVLVGATYNGSITLAAVGPASVLTLNTLWNRPQQFGQVYWYRTEGKSFGFSPTITIRQTSADNEDLDSPLRLSWLLDQNMGGYRAGVTRSLADNTLWHKIIYCN